MQKPIGPIFRRFELDAKRAASMQVFAKQYFDFIRNIVIVGSLKFAADKSENILMFILFGVSGLILCMGVISYILSWNIHFFRARHSNLIIGNMIDFFITVVVAVCCVSLMMYVIVSAINNIVAAHT